MTLKTQMESDASVFLNKDDFAEVIEHRPYGGTAVAITAIVDRDTNYRADGDSYDSREGAKIPRYGILTVAESLVVTADERSDRRDLFLIDNEIWTAVRVRDPQAGTKFVDIYQEQSITTKRGGK